MGQCSVTEDQMDLLAVESVVGALGYGLFGHLFTGECDQGLAAALSTEVVQNENSIRLELQGRQKQMFSVCRICWTYTAQTPLEPTSRRMVIHLLQLGLINRRIQIKMHKQANKQYMRVMKTHSHQHMLVWIRTLHFQ